MRHRIALAALAVLTVAATPALAQTKLTVAGYGGSFEEMMRKDLIPAFEKKYNAKIEYVAGNSTNNLARLQAQKGNQEIDVAIVDDGPMYQAVALGFCTDLKGVPLADIHEPAKMGPKAIGLGMVATGLVYNKKYFADNKLPAPTSWNDLADPKFKKKVVVPPLNNTYGLHTVVMYARLGGGGEKNIDPGFATMKDKVGPNVLVYEPNPGKMTELFQSGQAVIAVWGSGRVKALRGHGLPGRVRVPEGGRRRARRCDLSDREAAGERARAHVHRLDAHARGPGAAGEGTGLRPGEQEDRAVEGGAGRPALRRGGGQTRRRRLERDQREARRLEQAVDARDRAVTQAGKPPAAFVAREFAQSHRPRASRR